MTEAEFKNQVIELAKRYGWLVHHDLPAIRSNGSWATNTQGHAGFPDLVLARRGSIIFAELKSLTGKLTPGQQAWLKQLDASNGLKNVDMIVQVWRPDDMEMISDILNNF